MQRLQSEAPLFGGEMGDVHTLVSADRNDLDKGCEEIVIKNGFGGALR